MPPVPGPARMPPNADEMRCVPREPTSASVGLDSGKRAMTLSNSAAHIALHALAPTEARAILPSFVTCTRSTDVMICGRRDRSLRWQSTQATAVSSATSPVQAANRHLPIEFAQQVQHVVRAAGLHDFILQPPKVGEGTNKRWIAGRPRPHDGKPMKTGFAARAH